jgi:ribonuclease HI
MYFNGSVMKEGANVGLVFISPLGVRMEYMVRLHFSVSNNTTEYEALINGLRIAAELGIKRIETRGDSELVVDQVMKDKNCVDPKMAAYCQAVRDLEGKFHGHELHHVLRATAKQPTYSQRPHPVKARFLMGSSRVINMCHLYEQKARNHLTSRSLRSWQSISH